MNYVIHCPTCGQRLFDIQPPTAGTIEIKCPRCRKLQHIHLIQPKKTEQNHYLAKE